MNVGRRRAIEHELQSLEAALAAEIVDLDGETYRRLQDRYREFIEIQKELEELEFDKKNYKLKLKEIELKTKELEAEVKENLHIGNKVWRYLKEGGDLVWKVAILLTVIELGKLAYAGDQDLKLVNGRVFNLATALLAKVKFLG